MAYAREDVMTWRYVRRCGQLQQRTCSSMIKEVFMTDSTEYD